MCVLCKKCNIKTAHYNPPWMLWFLKRNELIMKIDAKKNDVCSWYNNKNSNKKHKNMDDTQNLLKIKIIKISIIRINFFNLTSKY